MDFPAPQFFLFNPHRFRLRGDWFGSSGFGERCRDVRHGFQTLSRGGYMFVWINFGSNRKAGGYLISIWAVLRNVERRILIPSYWEI